MILHRVLLTFVLSALLPPVSLANGPADDERPARFVRIELPGEARILSLAEVLVMRNGRNLALGGAPSQIATSNDAGPGRANDGSWDGNFNTGSVTHTPEIDDAWWELDLGTDQIIDSVVIFNRTDCCAERLDRYSILLLDSAREVVWSRENLPAPKPRADFSIWGRAVVDPTITPEERRKVQAGIDVAIDRGARYLLDIQLRDGSWGSQAENYGCGSSALAVYTLIKSGIPRTHPGVELGIENLRRNRSHKTYSLGCQLMAATAIADESDSGWIEELLGTLLGSQANDGLWAYPESHVDLSNAQYAALGLYAAQKNGFEVPKKVWFEILEETLEYQKDPTTAGGVQVAGFSYRKGNGQAETGSMTTAGISILCICEWALGSEIKKRMRSRIERSKELGLAWLAHHFSVEKNPNKGDQHLYYLYGLERVGALTGLDRIGSHDWYWEGSKRLIQTQSGEGQWNSQTDTCFALLFLSKATSSSRSGPSDARKAAIHSAESEKAEVRFRATGEKAVTMWITGFGDFALDQFVDEEDIIKGLRIEKVDYWCGDDIIHSVNGDPNKAWAGERFAVRHEFPKRGTYELQVQVHVLDPYAEEGETGRGELWSDTLTVEVKQAYEPFMMEYAQQGAENLLRGVGIKTTASSVHNQEEGKPDSGNRANWAVDGLHSTYWLSKSDDKAPSLILELDRAVRANTFLFSHANAHNQLLNAHDRATKIELWINKARKPLIVDLVDSDLEKTVYKMKKTERISRVEIKVIERTTGEKHPGLVGFSEIEVLWDKKKKKRGR